MGKSPFTMPGSEFLGKGNQSVAPGKYTESPAKIMPSYINDVMVSDEEANIQDMKNEDLIAARNKGILKPGVFEENIKKVKREGTSQAIHIEKTEKDPSGKLGRLEKDMITDAKKWATEHPEEEAESYAINKAAIEKKKQEKRKKEEGNV